jgi:hypothetical protein
MAGAYDRDYAMYNPPDLKKDVEAAKAEAAKTSPGSYEVKLKLPLTRAAKVFSFWFTYLYENPETKIVTEGPRSPTVQHGFDVPNLTKPVLNLTLTAGFKSYGVKFDVDPTSVQEDVVIFESLTGSFAGEQYIVYVGTSTNITINTSDFAPRWVRVRVRDKWLTSNNSEATAGPVTPRNADPDTSTPPSAPQSASVTGSIDSNDKSGFSAKLTASWTANSDNNTSGYIIRWTTQNPATTPNPLWEYGQVDGKATTTFDITGLIPNTLYYWQVTAKSPYNALTWIGAQSGTVGPIVDANAPADAFAQLRSIISIGGKTADLFKIGTGISQSINTSTTITPSQTSGNYSGIILNKSTTNFGHNYWLNTGQFRVGSPTNFLYWDGSDLYTTGKINATGGSFSGDVQISTGSLYAGAQPNTGARVRLNSAGLFAYDTNNNQTVAITQADGKLDARQGFIAGWTINVPSGQTFGTISRNATIFDSNGNITLGDTTGTLPSIVRLSATDSTYRLWVGSQSPSTAAFKVDSNGKLYATGAVIDGTASIAGTVTIGGTTASTVVSNASTAVSTANTASSNASTALANAQAAATEANTAKVSAAAAKAIADAALPSTSFNRDAIVNSINSTTTTTTINGGKITTGTVSANAVVSDFISTFSLNADKITAGTLTGRDIDISNDSTSNRFRTSYSRTTPVSGTTVSTLGINAIAMISTSTAGVVSSWYPYLHGEQDLGVLSPNQFYWRNLRYTNSLIQSSDRRLKRNIEVSDLGLEFINSLRPVKYQRYYTPNSRVLDDEGKPIINEDGSQVVDESLNYIGDRYHYGLIAQEVKESLDLAGVGSSFSGWVLDDPEDADSYQSLGYDKFISPMIKSIQELSDMVESLQQELNTLKGI